MKSKVDQLKAKIEEWDNKGCAAYKAGKTKRADECANKMFKYERELEDLIYDQGMRCSGAIPVSEIRRA